MSDVPDRVGHTNVTKVVVVDRTDGQNVECIAWGRMLCRSVAS